MVFRTYDLAVFTEPARAGSDTDTYVAENAVLQGQVVKQGTAQDQCTPSDTDGEKVLGVALYDAAAGATVDVVKRGNAVRLTSGTGTISADDPITSYGATGEEGEVDTATTAGAFVLGRAKEDDAGTNDDVIVELDPQPGSEL